MDKVYRCDDPRIFRLYHGLPPRLCGRHPSTGILHGIPGSCATAVDRHHLLFHPLAAPCHLFEPRLLLEIVSA